MCWCAIKKLLTRPHEMRFLTSIIRIYYKQLLFGEIFQAEAGQSMVIVDNYISREP